MELKNYMEDAIVEQLDKLFHTHDCCRCERCKADIVAYTLNHIPSKYIVTQRGHIYTKLNQLKNQSKADIIVALEKAIHVVSNKPRHTARKD